MPEGSQGRTIGPARACDGEGAGVLVQIQRVLNDIKLERFARQRASGEFPGERQCVDGIAQRGGAWPDAIGETGHVNGTPKTRAGRCFIDPGFSTRPQTCSWKAQLMRGYG